MGGHAPGGSTVGERRPDRRASTACGKGETPVRFRKTFGLAVLAALAAAAFLGAPSAEAELTALCKANEYPCPTASRASSLNMELASGAVWSLHTTNPTFTVLCLTASLKGTALEIGSPQLIDRTAQSYSGCGTTTAHNNCTVTAFFEKTTYGLLKTGVNSGELESRGGEFSVKCTVLEKTKLQCTYKDKGLVFKFEGKSGTNGHGRVKAAEVKVEKLGGEICPEQSVLTTTLEPSEDVYLGGGVPSKEEDLGLGNPADPNICKVCTGDPIDPASGNLTESQTDLSVNGRGPALAVTRSYNSQLAAAQASAGSFGYGWTGPYSASLEVSAETETATVHQDNGSTTVFFLTEGKYVPYAWTEATFAKEGENYIYTLPKQEKLEFNKSGQLIKTTDRHGNALTLTYKEGALETVKDAAGRVLTYAYKEGKVASIKDPMGHEVKYTYESGNLATVTLPGEETARWKFKYDASHRLTEVTDGRGHTTKNEYDSSGRVKQQTDRLEHKRTFEYKETEGVKETTVTEPNGSKTLEKFNQAGEPTEVTKASGTELAQTYKYEYNSSLALTKVTDPSSHVTTYGYDSEGNRTSQKDPNENETKWVYNKTHDIVEETTPKGETTTITRNSAGDPETIKRPVPGEKTQETKFKYAANGDLEVATDPLGHETKFEYDSYGDRKAEINPSGDKRTWSYNEDGQLTSEVSPRGNEEEAEAAKFETKTERDAQGHPIKVTDPLGHEKKFKYDANGNLEVLTNANGHATTYAYDANDQRIEVKAANGNVTKTAYDAEGKVKSKTNGNEQTTTFERNSLEQVVEVIDPLERKTTKKYDSAGNLKEVKDPEARTITYSYDAGNRLKEINYSEEATKDVSFKYDKDGNITEMTDGTGTTKKTYDELDRLTEVENGNKEVIKYKYDLGNEVTEVTYPNGKSITRGYDSVGRLEKVTDWLGGETKFAYNRDSAPTSTTFPSESGNKDEYGYNQADQLTKTTMKKGAETLASLSYTRDKASQLETSTQTGLPGTEKIEYVYDEKERLTKGAGTSFAYDAANNPTTLGSTTLKYDKASQLEEGGGVKYAFDKFGERIKATPATGPATTYGYDQAGNLISVKRSEEGQVKKIEDTYAYDGNGLRASQTINGTTTHMAWDVAEKLPLLLYDGVNYYVYGPEGLPIEQISSEAPTYMHHDQQGSTRLLTNSKGEVKGAYTFAPYGAIEEHTGSATTPLGFDAQYTSEDTGLIYLRARVYDPSTAQFMTLDPLIDETGETYGYAGGNPVNAGDPSGQRIPTVRFPGPGQPGPRSNDFNYFNSGFDSNQFGYAYWQVSAWRDGADAGWSFSAIGWDVNWGYFTWTAWVTRIDGMTTWSIGIFGTNHLPFIRSGFGCPLYP